MEFRERLPFLCVSQKHGKSFICQAEVIWRINETIQEEDILEVVDHMALRREWNGEMIWFTRLRLPEEKFPYLLAQKPLGNATGYNPASWLSFGNASKHSLIEEGGKATAKLWTTVEFTLLQAPVKVFVSVPDIPSFYSEALHYLKNAVLVVPDNVESYTLATPVEQVDPFFEDLTPLTQEEDGDPEQTSQETALDQDSGYEQPLSQEMASGQASGFEPTSQEAEENQEFGYEEPSSQETASGLVQLEFECATEAMMAYDLLEKLKYKPRIQVFPIQEEVEACVERSRLAVLEKYRQLRYVEPSYANRFDPEPSPMEPVVGDVEQREGEDSAELDLGQFAFELEDGGFHPVQVDLQANDQPASTYGSFDLPELDLVKENKEYSGSLQRLMKPNSLSRERTLPSTFKVVALPFDPFKL